MSKYYTKINRKQVKQPTFPTISTQLGKIFYFHSYFNHLPTPKKKSFIQQTVTLLNNIPIQPHTFVNTMATRGNFIIDSQQKRSIKE